MEKTYVIKGKPESKWILVDANDQTLGRLTTQIACYLLGKHKPSFTPGVEMGDFVVVVNADKLRIAAKQLDTKMYYRHSNYPGGLKSTVMREMMRTKPEKVIRKAVWGMLPHNKFGRHIIRRLKIYAGAAHPHEAQNPQPIS